MRGPSLFAADGDPGRHIRVGTYILETRSIPDTDVFSHTMFGETFIPFEWLSEIIFAAFHMWAGLAGDVVLVSLLFAATVGLVYVTMTRAGIPSLIAFGFAFASMILQAAHLHPRPHMFTTLLVAAFAYLLLESRRDGRTRRLLLLPVLMLLWANLHGGFLVGFILLVLFLADAWLRSRQSEGMESRYAWTLTGIVGLCFAASLITPAGVALWPHTTGYLGEKYLVAFTQEYNSPNFHDPLLKFFLAVLMAGTGVLALLRSRVDFLGVTMWILFAAFSLHSGRNIPLFAVLAIPWMAGWTVMLLGQEADHSPAARRFQEWSGRFSSTEDLLPGWPVAGLGLVILTVLALQPDRREAIRFSAKAFPVDAVEFLYESGFEPPGPVYNEFGWGGYLLYRAWPDIPVFIDGQTDFYGEELTREYVAIRALEPGWQEHLDRHDVRWALIPPDVALNQALDLSEDWESAYSDSTASVWVRTVP